MGIFGSREQVNLEAPGQVEIATTVRENLPDPAGYFIEWFGLTSEARELLSAEIDGRRHANGEVVTSMLSDAPPIGRKQTPMTLLRTMLSTVPYVINAWGTADLSRRDSKGASKIIHSLTHEQGAAAAITWVRRARPDWNDPVGFNYLTPQIVSSWEEGLDWVLNIDISRALKNWTK